jgi:hypothetical protein
MLNSAGPDRILQRKSCGQESGSSGGLHARDDLALERNPTEIQADSIPAATTDHRPLAISSGGVGTVQRSLIGDIGGATIGLGLAPEFGIWGAVAGAVVGDAVTADTRSLTFSEVAEARQVFGDSLHYSDVEIAEAPLMSLGGYARTPFNTIYFRPGRTSEPHLMPLLIHELTHVWQSQHGISVLVKAFWAVHGQSAYDYGGQAGLNQAFKGGKHFSDFNTEQQGDILRDYYETWKAGGNTSAFDPFVAEVKATK